MNKKLFCLLILATILTVPCTARIIIGGTSQVPKILPLGDSITVGSGDQESTGGGQFGYRDHLQTLLGVSNFVFVGPYTDPDSDATFGVNHAGVGGEKASSISSRLDSLLVTYMSEIVGTNSKVLIHAGTNDCNQSVPNNTTVSYISGMIDKIDSFNSDIDVYVAKITPTHTTGGGVALNACIDTLNPLIESMVLARQATKANVHVVDMNAAFKANPTWENDYMSGVGLSHPKDAGYQVMANTWYSCISDPNNTYCDGN